MSDTNAPRIPPISENKTFFQALIDPDFKEWVTLRVAGVLYVIGMILVSLLAVIGYAAYVFSSPGFALALAGLLIAIASWFLLILLLRLGFEASIALVSVAQNTASLRK
jgi:hypothetical protein